jgi:hypothetical protein
MKYIKPILLLLLTVFCFTACIDSEEKIEINADNSGNYSLSIDMSKMLELAAQMGAGKNNADKPKEKKDTIIYFKDAMAKADQLTNEEKELFKDAFCKVKLDEANSEMKISISCPFSNISRLAEIKEKLPAMMDKLKVMDKVSDKEKSPLSSPDEEMGGGGNMNKSINPGSQYYKFTAEPGKLSYLITDKAALKNSMATDSSLTMMKQMTALTGEMSYKSIIVLPSPVKKLSGGKGVLSDDKKTITYKATLSDMTEHPEEMEYQIEY